VKIFGFYWIHSIEIIFVDEFYFQNTYILFQLRTSSLYLLKNSSIDKKSISGDRFQKLGQIGTLS
jgi:hypothetical protein